jgi:hypothetical protein
MSYYDRVDLRSLEWIIENASTLNLGKSYVNGALIGGDGQLELLRKYYKRAVLFEGLIPVSYYQLDNDGRRFSHDISLTNLSRPIRHTIAQGMIDLDVKNCHPCIVLWLCKKHGIECHYIERYVMNRDEMLSDLMTARKMSRDGAKKMLLRATNRDDGHFQQTEEDPVWLYDYHQQCKKIAEALTKFYPEYLTQAEKSKKRKDQSAWNMKGSALNRILCHHENEILKVIESVVQKHNGKVMNLAYDGCMVDDTFSKEEINELFLEIKSEIGKVYDDMVFDMSEKTMNEGYTVPSTFVTKKEKKVKAIQEKEAKRIKKEIDREIKEEDKEEEYQEWKIEFEKHHCKIMEPPSVVFTNSLGEFSFMDYIPLIQRYSHMPNYPDFINKWWYDSTMRVKCRADIYSPTQECPTNVFNLWKPYPYQDFKIEPSDLLEENVKFLLGHIDLLCNHDVDVYTYMLNWASQFLQYPHIKTTMPVFTSSEGAGKDSFLYMFKKLIGKNQVVETTRPEDVFGRFNSILANARLVILNEMNASDLHKYDKDMKMLITEDRIPIEYKGKGIYNLASFHRLMLFTNKIDHPIQTSKSDRRKLIVRCSDEKIGDSDYFNRLYTLLEDDTVMAAMFQFFMNRDVRAFNSERGRLIPKTEFQQTITENYSNPVEDWVKSLTEYLEKDGRLEYHESFTWNSAEALQSFKTYCSNNGIKLELSSVQLGVRLKNLNITGVGLLKTKSCNLRTFDLLQIDSYFNPKSKKEGE